MNTNIILVSGLAYALLGALILAMSHRSVCDAATQLIAGYPRVLAKLRVKRHDGRFGLGFLSCGIFLQVVAACGYTAPLAQWHVPALMALFILLLYSIWRLVAERPVVMRRAQSPGHRNIGKRVYETRRSFRLRQAAVAEAPKLYALEQSLQRRLGLTALRSYAS